MSHFFILPLCNTRNWKHPLFRIHPLFNVTGRNFSTMSCRRYFQFYIFPLVFIYLLSDRYMSGCNGRFCHLASSRAMLGRATARWHYTFSQRKSRWSCQQLFHGCVAFKHKNWCYNLKAKNMLNSPPRSEAYHSEHSNHPQKCGLSNCYNIVVLLLFSVSYVTSGHWEKKMPRLLLACNTRVVLAFIPISGHSTYAKDVSLSHCFLGYITNENTTK